MLSKKRLDQNYLICLWQGKFVSTYPKNVKYITAKIKNHKNS